MSETEHTGNSSGPTWDELLGDFSRRRIMEERMYGHDVIADHPSGPPPSTVARIQNQPTSPHSEFFRPNALHGLKAIAHDIAPEIHERTRRAVRIGQIACSGGQEAYSLAALLHKKGVPATITGMDINPAMLDKARGAEYPALPPKAHAAACDLGVANLFINDFPPRYMRPAPALQQMVSFTHHNILTSPLDSENPFDIVLAYNLFYHYNRRGRKRIIENIVAGLAVGGTFAYEGGIPVDIEFDYADWCATLGREFGLPASRIADPKQGLRTYDPEAKGKEDPLPPTGTPQPQMKPVLPAARHSYTVNLRAHVSRHPSE